MRGMPTCHDGVPGEQIQVQLMPALVNGTPHWGGCDCDRIRVECCVDIRPACETVTVTEWKSDETIALCISGYGCQS